MYIYTVYMHIHMSVYIYTCIEREHGVGLPQDLSAARVWCACLINYSHD